MTDPPFKKHQFAQPKRGSIGCGHVHAMRNLSKWPEKHSMLSYAREDGITVSEYLTNPLLTEDLGVFVECPAAYDMRVADQKARNREMRAQMAEWAHEHRNEIEAERALRRHWTRARSELISKINDMVDGFNSTTPYEEIYEIYT